MSPEPDAAKAQAHFERAIAITRAEGKVLGAARERRAWPGCCAITKNGSRPAIFLPPEGFDTADLKDAKALLGQLTEPAIAAAE